MINKVVLVGRITKDPELRKTLNNKSLIQFNLAVNKKYKNEEGNYEADFISCMARNQSAEYLTNYAHKGDLIGVSGSIQTRNYEGKDGKKVYITEVKCDEVSILNSKVSKEETNFEEALLSKEKFGGSLKIGNEIVNEDDLPFY